MVNASGRRRLQSGGTRCKKPRVVQETTDPGAPDGDLSAAHVAGVAAIVAIATLARFVWFSGLGLGDDVLLRNDIGIALSGGSMGPGPNGYRFPWWAPTLLTCRLFGLTEMGLILPIVMWDVLGMLVVGLLGGVLFGGTGALLATALVAVTPLDFAWATMLTTDIPHSASTALAFLFAATGLRGGYGARALCAWALAGVALWLAVHAKLSGLSLPLAFAILAWRYRSRLTPEALAFPLTAGLLVAISGALAYGWWGTPLASLDAELKAQGLVGAQGAREHAATVETFLVFPRLLFQPNWLGDLVFGVVPHLAVLGLLARPLGVRGSPVAFWWMVVVAAGMELNVQRAAGVWVAGFRNVRHMHPLVYPLVLLLVGQILALGRRWPRVAGAVAVAALAVGAWQSVTTAQKTVVSFADRREAVAFLLARPPKPIYSDFQLGHTLLFMAGGDPRWRSVVVQEPDRPGQQRELDAIRDGYLVTGGGREPYYGCTHCIPSAEQVSPTRWRLLWERPGPPPRPPWRYEPLRVWEAVGSG